MNNKLMEELIPKACDVIINVHFENEKGKIPSAFRSQISSFGAAVANGSLLAAIAFFSQQNGAKVERQKLMTAINELLKETSSFGSSTGNYGKSLYETVRINSRGGILARYAVKEKVMSCALALKLAFNLFDLDDENGNDNIEKDQKPAEEAKE